MYIFKAFAVYCCLFFQKFIQIYASIISVREYVSPHTFQAADCRCKSSFVHAFNTFFLPQLKLRLIFVQVLVFLILYIQGTLFLARKFTQNSRNNRGSFVCFNLKIKMLNVIHYEIVVLFKLDYHPKERKQKTKYFSLNQVSYWKTQTCNVHVYLYVCNSSQLGCDLSPLKYLNFWRTGNTLLYL